MRRIRVQNVATFDLDDTAFLSRDYGDAVITVPVVNSDYLYPWNFNARDEAVLPLVEAAVGDSMNAIDVYFEKNAAAAIEITTFGECAWSADALKKLARDIVKALGQEVQA